jgi:hypothetical protein
VNMIASVRDDLGTYMRPGKRGVPATRKLRRRAAGVTPRGVGPYSSWPAIRLRLSGAHPVCCNDATQKAEARKGRNQRPQ